MLRQKIIQLLLILVLCSSCGAEGERANPFSLSVGTQSIGIRYQFSEGSALVESAREIAALGSDTLKIAVTPKYAKDYLMEKDKGIDSLLKLVNEKSAFLEVMDMPFRNIMLWIYPFSDSKSAFYKGKISSAEKKVVYEEIYEFTSFLLKRYSGSGKSFFLGNWEGDWHLLRENYDYDLDPKPETIAAAIEWFNIRQRAIADACREVAHEDVQVYYYVELNHVRKAMEDGRPTLVNQVLPHIKTDFVSWSSYDIIGKAIELGEVEGREYFLRALDYIESHLPESEITGKRVLLGEYGFPLISVESPEEQRKHSEWIMKWALEWGCPFILYWELYCNEIEPEDGKHRGFWLIDKAGIKQPVWYMHKAFLDKANAFVADYKKRNGVLPSQAAYNKAALEWIK